MGGNGELVLMAFIFLIQLFFFGYRSDANRILWAAFLASIGSFHFNYLIIIQ